MKKSLMQIKIVCMLYVTIATLNTATEEARPPLRGDGIKCLFAEASGAPAAVAAGVTRQQNPVNRAD